MKYIAMVVGLCILGWMTWRLGSSLSSDALGMAVGVLFGVLAGIPSALLVLASGHRQARRESGYYDDDDDMPPSRPQLEQPHLYQPPIIVLATPREQQSSQSMPLITDRQQEIVASGRVIRVINQR